MAVSKRLKQALQHIFMTGLKPLKRHACTTPTLDTVNGLGKAIQFETQCLVNSLLNTCHRYLSAARVMKIGGTSTYCRPWIRHVRSLR